MENVLYKVICDECGKEMDTFNYPPTNVDLQKHNIMVYAGMTFCCEGCLESFKKSHEEIESNDDENYEDSDI